MLQVFESHAEYLGPDQFTEFALPYIQQIQQRVRSQIDANIPMVGGCFFIFYVFGLLKRKSILCLVQCIFPKGGHFALEEVGKAGYDIVGIDWTVRPEDARRKVGPNVTVQGNFDPCALYGPKVCAIS